MNEESRHPASKRVRVACVAAASLAAGVACGSVLVIVGFIGSFIATYLTGDDVWVWIGCWGAMGLSPFAFIIGAGGTAVWWSRRRTWSVSDAVKFILVCLAVAILPPLVVGWFV